MADIKATVLGAGSWGTTFAAVMADAGSDVTLWGRREEVVAAVNNSHENPVYLAGLPLPQSLKATTDIAAALDGADIVVVSIPAQQLRAALSDWIGMIDPAAKVVSLMKGIELSTGLRMTEVMAAEGVAAENIVCVSGPNLAPEIAARQPTATVVGATHLPAAELVAGACSTRYFRPYTNTDVVGMEIGGAVKNVIALALGIAEGRGLGHNTQASLITRGLAETARLAGALGADPRTLSGLAGMGDLVATCMSPMSRNRSVGVRLGKGETLADIMASQSQTAEGVKSCAAIQQMAQTLQVDMPIVDHMAALLAGKISVENIGRSLLDRPRKSEAK